jgi:hypothetical protein
LPGKKLSRGASRIHHCQLSIIHCPFFCIPTEVIAEPQKKGAKPVRQDVHVDHRISNIAAQAASTIVNCQLSIVHSFVFPLFKIISIFWVFKSNWLQMGILQATLYVYVVSALWD